MEEKKSRVEERRTHQVARQATETSPKFPDQIPELSTCEGLCGVCAGNSPNSPFPVVYIFLPSTVVVWV